jgi:uncharacterized protein YjeT (DUF2065 family)
MHPVGGMVQEARPLRPSRRRPRNKLSKLMLDLIAALGLALAVEGILFAAFPDGMRRAMYEAAHSPSDRMRLVGILSAIAGLGIVWVIRYFG